MTMHGYDPSGFKCPSCKQKKKLYFICKKCGERCCIECGQDEDGRRTVLCKKCRKEELKIQKC